MVVKVGNRRGLITLGVMLFLTFFIVFAMAPSTSAGEAPTIIKETPSIESIVEQEIVVEPEVLVRVETKETGLLPINYPNSKYTYGTPYELTIWGDSMYPALPDNSKLSARKYPFELLETGMIIYFYKQGEPYKYEEEPGQLKTSNYVIHRVIETHHNTIPPYVITHGDYSPEYIREKVTRNGDKGTGVYYYVITGVLE